MENDEWGIRNGKMGINFQFFWFRFTVYNKEQIFFIDIHVLFQKRPGAKSKERYELMIRKGVSFV